MNKNGMRGRALTKAVASLLLSSVGVLVAPWASSDEGGTSFWLPGQFGSLAATPSDPGWSLPLIYYHASVDAEGGREFATDGRITLGLEVEEDLLLAVPTYVFNKPVLGGQAAISVSGIYGRVDTSVDATLEERGGDILSGSESDSLTAVGDLYPSLFPALESWCA